jgi:hypothetical protein
MVGLIVFAVVASLWMAWRLGAVASVQQNVSFRTPSLPARTMPNPQPAPNPVSPTPR